MTKPPFSMFASSRRRFLRGLGGVSVGLPLLDAFTPRRARAAAGPVPCVFIVEMNGVQQAMQYGVNGANLGEPDRFWPATPGPLTNANLGAQTGQALSELKDYGSQMLAVRGMKLAFPGNGCGHSGGGNQVLTAAKVSDDPAKNKSLAMGESVDHRIAVATTGREPLALYSGPKYGYINDHVSFRGAKDLIVGEQSPWNAYSKIVGMVGTDTVLQQKVATRRKSVNDLIRGEMQALLGRKDLSVDDRKRLDLHFQSIRDLEIKITATLPDDRVALMKGLDPGQAYRNDDKRGDVVKLQYDILTLALSSGFSRVAVVQNGDGTDGMGYVIDGVKQTNFHHISHRINSDGADGTPIAGADILHHKIDRVRLQWFKYLLDRWAATSTPDGSLLDIGFAVWTNQIAHGNHGYDNVPYIIVGKARGALKTGQFLAPAMTANNKLLNALINAAGVRKADGSPVDDFGDPSLPKGSLAGVLV